MNFLPVGHRASAVSSFRFFQLFFVPSTALFLAVQAVSGFLKYPLFLCLLVWVLVYYITENNVCQAFFEKNNPILSSKNYMILLIDGIRFLLYDNEYLQLALFDFLQDNKMKKIYVFKKWEWWC